VSPHVDVLREIADEPPMPWISAAMIFPATVALPRVCAADANAMPAVLFSRG
jgi:hypothetical protein